MAFRHNGNIAVEMLAQCRCHHTCSMSSQIVEKKQWYSTWWTTKNANNELLWLGTARKTLLTPDRPNVPSSGTEAASHPDFTGLSMCTSVLASLLLHDGVYSALLMYYTCIHTLCCGTASIMDDFEEEKCSGERMGSILSCGDVNWSLHDNIDFLSQWFDYFRYFRIPHESIRYDSLLNIFYMISVNIISIK